MIDCPCLGERPHFLVVVPLLGEHPLEVRDSLAPFDFLPYFAIGQYLPDEILVVVGLADEDGELVSARDFDLGLLLRVAIEEGPVVRPDVDAVRQAGRCFPLLLLGLRLLGWYFAGGLLLGGIAVILLPLILHGRFLGVDRSDALAHQDVGKRGLVVPAPEHAILGGNDLLIDPAQDARPIHVEIEGVLDLREHGLGVASFLALEENPFVDYKLVHLKQFY